MQLLLARHCTLPGSRTPGRKLPALLGHEVQIARHGLVGLCGDDVWCCVVAGVARLNRSGDRLPTADAPGVCLKRVLLRPRALPLRGVA